MLRIAILRAVVCLMVCVDAAEEHRGDPRRHPKRLIIDTDMLNFVRQATSPLPIYKTSYLLHRSVG
jgi:hypothetical protein